VSSTALSSAKAGHHLLHSGYSVLRQLVFATARQVSRPDSAYLNRNGDPTMARHSHQFTIADDEAVRALVEKLVGGQASNQARREKLLRALDDATRHYKDSNQKVRRAFFHGLLTGYAVALKLG
jgi:hypothetical protein